MCWELLVISLDIYFYDLRLETFYAGYCFYFLADWIDASYPYRFYLGLLIFLGGCRFLEWPQRFGKMNMEYGIAKSIGMLNCILSLDHNVCHVGAKAKFKSLGSWTFRFTLFGCVLSHYSPWLFRSQNILGFVWWFMLWSFMEISQEGRLFSEIGMLMTLGLRCMFFAIFMYRYYYPYCYGRCHHPRACSHPLYIIHTCRIAATRVAFIIIVEYSILCQ